MGSTERLEKLSDECSREIDRAQTLNDRVNVHLDKARWHGRRADVWAAVSIFALAGTGMILIFTALSTLMWKLELLIYCIPVAVLFSLLAAFDPAVRHWNRGHQELQEVDRLTRESARHRRRADDLLQEIKKETLGHAPDPN